MAGKGARYRRQIRRAKELGRGIVIEDDLTAVIGMTLDEVNKYAAEKKLKVRICKVDGVKEIYPRDTGPDLLSIDVVAGLVSVAKCSNLKKPLENML